MLFAYNKVHPKLIRNLPRIGACDFGIPSVERSRPSCSLHQGASLWNDAPAGAAPGQKTGTRPFQPQDWTLSPNDIRQIHLVTAPTGERPNGRRLHGIFHGGNS